jgi:hypothetical protein
MGEIRGETKYVCPKTGLFSFQIAETSDISLESACNSVQHMVYYTLESVKKMAEAGNKV